MMKISKSKRQLAQLLIEAGVTQFPEGANCAAQDGDKDVDFFTDKPYKAMSWWQGKYDHENRVSLSVKIPNWHQTVMSRDEFDQIVAETAVQGESDSDGWIEWKGGEQPVEYGTLIDVKFRDGMEMFAAPVGVTTDDFPRHVLDWSHDDRRGDIIAYRLRKPEQAEPQYCESVTRSIPEPTAPTLDQLLQDWRNADDYAQRKQAEADEAAAMRDERWNALQARAGEMGLTVGRCESVAAADEPELVITNWRDLLVGDEIEVVESNSYSYVGRVGVVSRFDKTDDQQPVRVIFYGSECDYDWPTKWRFIRRP